MTSSSEKPADASGRLLLSVFLNGLITLVEFTGGILSNSLALVSDAIHNLSDTLALFMAWIAHRIGKRRPDHRRTFGYQRFGILSAFINASVLSGVSIYLIYEAVLRFLEPEPVKSNLMLVIALTGLVANLLSMLFLHRDSKQSLNVRAAYLHLLGDTLSSVGVVAGAILMHYLPIYWIDPLLTVVISVVIIRQAYGILRASVEILMQSTPPHIDLEEICKCIGQIEQVRNLHHVHCWQLQDQDVLFEAHVETRRDMPVSESGQLRSEIERVLREQFGITHATLQVEFEHCEDTSLIRNPA